MPTAALDPAPALPGLSAAKGAAILPLYTIETDPLSRAVLGAEAGPVGMPLFEMLRDRPYVGVDPGLAATALVPGGVVGSAELGLWPGLPSTGAGLLTLPTPGNATASALLGPPPTTGIPGGGAGKTSSSSPSPACWPSMPPAASTSSGTGLVRIRPDALATADVPIAATRPPPRPMREPDTPGGAPLGAALEEMRVLMDRSPASPMAGVSLWVCMVDARVIAGCFACAFGIPVTQGA
jgi:hypothetical protein